MGMIISGIASIFGKPTKLIRKTLLVSEDGLNRLPVYTLTFEIPRNVTYFGIAKPLEHIRIEYGEVVKMVIPGYKPKSYSVSALRVNNDNDNDDHPNEYEFDVTVKIYPNGRASGYLDRMKVGDTIRAFGMANRKTRSRGTFFGGVAFGVGITEILPMARYELENGAGKVVVLWASRTKADTFWHEDIHELKRAYRDRFEMVHLYSRETERKHLEEKGVLQGRIDATLLKEVFETRLSNAGMERDDAKFLVIGTRSMMNMTNQMFTRIGFPMHKHGLLI